MQLMRLADVPTDQNHRVFHYSLYRAVIGAITLLALAGGALLLGWVQDVWLAYYVAAVLLIFLLIFHKLVTARFRRSNWLLRLSEHGLFIKFRSYLNSHFDDRDITVVFIPYSEIRSARLVKERQELLDRDAGNLPETSTRTRRRVELELAENTTPLAKALSSERERLFSKSVVGAGRISTRYQHLPVRLASGNFLCVEWGVVPSAPTLLDVLSRHTLIKDAAAISRDFINLDGLSKEEKEARLLELAESGDMMGAVALARRLYSYDLTAAKQFVEELVTRQSNLTDQ
jgi:hypothetical protein